MTLWKVQLFERRVIGGEDNPLMIRWVLIRFPWFGIYVHKFCRSDYDRALHDHPWPFVSIILRGGYWEFHDQTQTREVVSEFRPPGSVLLRPAEWRHRVVISEPSWSLILVGKRFQQWGFFLPTGWCWWRKFDSTKNICEDEILHMGGKD